MTALSIRFCILAHPEAPAAAGQGASWVGVGCLPRMREVCRLPAATLVCNVHHPIARDRPQSPLLVQPCVIAVPLGRLFSKARIALQLLVIVKDHNRSELLQTVRTS